MSDGIGVFKAIIAVQGELAKEGIAKDKRNTQGSGYMFRGIDDVYNALAPLLAKHHLCILPRILARDSIERVSKQGGALFYTTVEAEFDFVSAEDGSKHTVRTFGEAMDSGDKGTNKAMSAAYKYAAFQAFCIPTEGDNDADASTHEVKPKTTPTPKKENVPQGPSDAQIAKVEEFALALNDTADNLVLTLSDGKVKTLAELRNHPATWTGAVIGKAEKLIKERDNA